MNWEQTYTAKIVTADEAVRSIQSGDHIFLTGNCSVPQRLLAALVRCAPELHDVEIYQALAVAGPEYTAPEMAGHLRVNSLFTGSGARKAPGRMKRPLPLLISGVAAIS